MTNLDSLTPREMCAGLMRGDAATLQLGYNYRAAYMVTADRKHLAVEELADLESYARGFADGMAEALERAIPEERYARVRRAEDRIIAYSDGYADGRAEDPYRLHPALSRVTS